MDAPPATHIENHPRYETGEDMMKQGAEALHEQVASKVELALGRAMPQIEVRFKGLSIVADLVSLEDQTQRDHVIADDSDLTPEQQQQARRAHHRANDLPTIPNHVMKSVAKFSSKKHHVHKHIVRNITGSFKPGTITLILGQSGSGKSALMKYLSGRFPVDKGIRVDGEVSYNSVLRQDIVKRLPQFVAYVTQSDRHFPTLTVKETLEFAHECCGAELSQRAIEYMTNGSPEENQQAVELARAIFKHYPEIVIEELGLQDCQDTIVGNAMLRGISGGERKRLTTGEMEFGMKYVTLMDEISTGLDSAAAFDIINAQRSIAKRLRRTVVLSLLQPSPEVFALFDNVMLLNEGEVMYHGPCSKAVEYFENLGFVCPPRRDVADFLCDLGTDQQVQYQIKSPPHGHKHHPRQAREFADIFEQSDIYAKMMEEMDAPIDPELATNVVNHMDPVPEFYQSFGASMRTLLTRQMRLTIRNHAFLKGRALMVIVIGLMFSSVFHDFDPRNVQVVMGILFASIMFLALGQASMLPTFFAAREVFYKQRAANFYRTSTYVLANSICQLPFSLIESLVFGSLVYWICGFVPKAELFILFLVLLVLTNMAFSAWYFFLSAVPPNLHIAKPLTMVSLLLYVLFAGFVQTKKQIPDYFIWAYWIDPVAWALRSMAIMQYRDDRYAVDVYHKEPNVNYRLAYNMTMGEFYLTRFDVETDKQWIAYGYIYMAGAYLLFMFMSWFVLEYHRYERPEHISLPEEDDDKESEVNDEAENETMYSLVTTPKHSASPNDSDVAVTINRRERSITPVAIAFQDIWYTVPDPTHPKQTLDLLKGISGFALPGKMTALMGSSGAGKTTLMDVIAGRKTGGKIRGKILLNGHEATDLAIRRSTGYCEQMDIHSEAATFREALTFSAFLRQSSDVSAAAKYDSVDECIELLNMEPIADQIIRGSSPEQMKRLTIGVELAAQPSVIFLDEPTSGLDARSAKVIMDGVRKVADSGRTILCTIHQPSSEVFHLFDSLLLLKRGGEVVFFGDLGFEGSRLIEYFEAIPSVHRIANGYNPATWMLEVIGAGVHHGDGSENDFVAHYQASANKQALDARMGDEGLFQPSSAVMELTFSKKRAATNATQLQFLMRRFWNMYWRTPSYNWTRWVISLALGLLFGLLYLDATYTTYQGVNGGLGMIFLTTAFIGLVSFISVLPIASEERASFYRERACQTYNSLWFFLGFTVVEVPYVIVGSFLLMIVFYPMVGFKSVDKWALYWLNLALHVLLQTYIGQFLAFALPSVEVAAIIGVLLNGIFLLFMGFNPPASSLPSGYKWLYNITPQRYTFSTLSAIVFGDCPDDKLKLLAKAAMLKQPLPDMSSWPLGCQFVTDAPPKVGHPVLKMYLEVVYGIKHEHIGRYMAFVVGAIVVFRILAALALRYINHQKR
ncbi:TPA: hypothetical protein N0F65_012479 [Lagenidium giganteum]|uniref:ABC transporter domain-containing protein n=1 Tax=Lagenidium giganteum TaxID=4803 RepID=A0AAV2YSY5_9STRA|nr:TPA: hypothetical protein N0F65_012479 [Lagenidium giganteum]